MTELLPVLALGFLLGIRHAADPDHVIAVSTIVSQHRSTRGAAVIGAVWGIGHSLTVLVIGCGILLLGWTIPPKLELSLEFVVALMLIGLGIATLRATWRMPEHTHAHHHGDAVHAHPHRHDAAVHAHAHEPAMVHWLDRRLAGVRVYQLARPLLVGVVHGMAGSAAVALLVLATITDRRTGVLYLLIFGIGTVAGMMIATAGISLPFAYGPDGGARWQRRLRFATGVASLGFGIMLAVRVGKELAG